MLVKIKKLNEKATLPTYGSEYSAGADLYACLDEGVTILPGQTCFIKTGLAMELTEGYVALIYARSGLACKRGLAPANTVGVVDCDYRGEITVALHNHSQEAQKSAGCSGNHAGCNHSHDAQKASGCSGNHTECQHKHDETKK